MVDRGRLLGILAGLLLSIPVFFRLLLRFLTLGCGIFHREERSSKSPETLSDPKWGKHKFINVNGVRLHYVEAGREEAPLLLFVHGFPEFWFSWRHQLKHFQHQFRVVAFDNRGYNRSSQPEGIGNYALENLVEDVRGLVKGLGAEKCSVVAHDWGGPIAWTFAALHPHMVENLIICNCPHPISMKTNQRENWRQMLKSWYMVFFQCPVLPELLAMSEDSAQLNSLLKDANLPDHQEVVEAYKFAFRDYATWNRAINYYRCAASKGSRQWVDQGVGKKLQMIQVRTLLIFGTLDKYLTVKSAEDSANFVKDFRLELLEGVSHWVQQEAPEAVNTLIEDFLTTGKK